MKELPMATKSISKKNSKVSKVKKAGIDAQYPSPKVVCRDKKLKKAKNFAKILKEVTECLNKVWKRLPPSAKFVLRLDSLQVKLVDDIGYFSFAHNYFVKDSCLPGRFTCEIDYNIHGYDYMRYSENMEFVLASSLALVYQYRLVNAAAAGIFGANMVDFLVQDPEDALFKPDEFNLPGFVRQLQQMKMTGPEGSSETCIPRQYAPVACAAAAVSGEGLCPAETGSKTGSKTETPGGKSAARAKILGILACITVMGVIISNLIDGFKGLSFVPSRNTVFWLGGAVLLLVLATAGVFYVRSRSRNRDIRPAGEHAKLSRFMAGVDRHPETSVSESPVQAVSEPPVQANFQPDSPSPQNAEPQGADETVLLGGAGCPVLRSVSGDMSVVIDKPEFIIGRNRDKSDYVIDNMGIGRTHALIKNIGGSSFLVDLDSRNGTLLNETRLLCNTRYRLTNNDKIAFANVEFYFITE